ncbi:N-acetylneuraminate epimerase [Duganella qianjiadongensis]|uniref:YjhT family mutarotase n=1 Tax=Duganella qianjiadongensis TaxID=2692176 RepID=A0ABW9VH74_9BURK|nr:N-acetylneuraminate epimerase [Duganella qianjiadongensis]MYM37929.1 YjhT family mutarotase [Duganella qianjiadongensis]
MKKQLCKLPLVLALCAAANTVAAPRYADFPVAAKMTVAAKIGSRIYAGLGTAGGAWFALDLSNANAQWEALAPFPGQPRDNANAVAIGTCIYVFNGQGKADPADEKLMMFDTVWKYDTVSKLWSQLATRSPMGGLGAAATTLDGENILFFGGVNKAVFDGYFVDYVNAKAAGKAAQDAVNEHYFSRRPQDYLFTAQILSYNPAHNQWRNLGLDPSPATAGSAIAVEGNTITLVGGEIKPGLRTPQVKHLTINGEQLAWQTPASMPPPAGSTIQEGIAGAYAGYSNGVLLAAGGASFAGAWQQYNHGQLYAHKGLSKSWRADIYARVGDQWMSAGKLPVAMGYGSYVQLAEGVLVIGGELQGGAASKAVFLLRWNGSSVEIID